MPYLDRVPNLSQVIDQLYNLQVGVTSLEEGPPHERPHKPLLLLAVLDLIDEGLATPDRIPSCRELRDRFTRRFEDVRKHNDSNTPDNPFRYRQGDGFWSAWKEGHGSLRPPMCRLRTPHPPPPRPGTSASSMRPTSSPSPKATTTTRPTAWPSAKTITGPWTATSSPPART